MCHHCGADLTKSEEDKKIPENENSLELNTQEFIGSRTLCMLKKMEEDGTPCATPMFSPVATLSSCDSSVSSSSEYSVDVNSYDRNSQGEKKINCRPEDVSYISNGHHNKSSFDSKGNGLDRSEGHTEGNLRENHKSNEKYIAKDVDIMQTSNGSEANDNSGAAINGSFDESTENSQPMKDEKKIPIWEPPEPEDPEDDVEGGVAFNDDDDECGGDGTKWGKPSSLSPYRDEESGSYKFKEDKQRAMEEVSNGKLKVFVSQLLKSVGVSSSVEDSENWVDIITSLSWEAAAFLKPNAIVGKAMDPDGYVKVKCIATGTRSQSQVVKGLVFKKHAAHKHMPTKHKNPRLLLVQGVLGQSSSGLSSFDSMEQEKDHLKSVIEMLALCHPNVVFVEKTVSRDIQESILKKGMTLVFDMKLHRLERIARCTGSPILSSDTLTSQKLKQCESFHFEKFVEEHASLIEGGKKPTKTLMFVEGCRSHQGCTILLKGAHSDELKKIKCVVQCAVIMAYHLIVETSFLVDQRAMFSTIPFAGVTSALFSEVENTLPTNKQSASLGTDNSHVSSLVEEGIGETESDSVDIPISNGFHDGDSYKFKLEIEGISPLYEPYNPAILTGLSSLSASLKKVIGENFPLASSSYKSLSSYLGFNRAEPNGDITKSSSGSASPKAGNHDIEEKNCSDELKSVNGDQVQSLECSEAFQELQKDDHNAEEEMQNKDDVNTMLDSQSILVLMSKRNALRGTVCEQSHFSHIMFYKNFDVPLGNFLRDNLLNQRRQCKVCGELPEAHLYYYAHHNKQLTIQVSRLPEDKRLRGAVDGKLWMWCRCGKCKAANETFKGSKRRLISSAARGLSFGKFLELSFSLYSSSSKISSCGHSLHRDFLYFFGLGRMVAMFRYSPIETYTVSVPPQKISFSGSIRQEWLKEHTSNVYTKGILLFIEVSNSLKKIKSQYEGLTLNLQGSLKVFSDIEEMLEQEKKEFEMKIQEAVERGAKPGRADYLLLNLNQLMWELLLESCIWDRRMESLLSPEHWVGAGGVTKKEVLEVMKSKMDRATGDEIISKEDGDIETNNGASLKVVPDTSVENIELPIKEILFEGSHEECKAVDLSDVSNIAGAIDTSSREDLTQTLSSLEASRASNGLNLYHSYDGRDDNFPLSDHQGDRTIPISTKNGNCDPLSHSNLSKNSTQHLHISNLENSSEWFWQPFGEISEMDIYNLRRVYLPKFESISKFTPNMLPTAHQLITEEGQRLHIPTGTDNYIVSDYDGELSSIIACALALLKDLPLQAEGLDNDGRASGGIIKMIESLQSLTRVPTITSPHWSPNGSFDFDSVHSTSSISLEESRFSSFDGLSLLDSLVPPGTLNPIVPLGASSSLPKGRYTVVCPYANHFRDLRNRCCPSELDYIASLSRCRNWDAKGGKSKSFFAKTFDDRLIIKEIKKTEFESFMKFAEDYFNYVKQSFELGNQTCLTKVLGIYQVIVRQSKSGKETRHDLMVMENLTFGRNMTRQYDLKGALHDRCILTDGSGAVLLDQNFVNDMNSSPLYVSNKSKRILQRAVYNDTKFLEKINVMDYSLLVGVDSQNRELVCGIIDYLRQYTWDKQLETWVKSSLVPKNLLPTVISPIEYKTRFRKFMSTHFLSVPDHWCSEKSSEECKLCGVGEDNITKIPA